MDRPADVSHMNGPLPSEATTGAQRSISEMPGCSMCTMPDRTVSCRYVDMNAPLADYAGPGHWNDPDMLVIGIDTSKTTVVNRAGAKGCTIEEYRSHMSLWCLMAAPLLAGNDIRNMNENIKEILMNGEIIAVNQDLLGKQAKKIRDDGDTEVFAKPLSDGSWAVGLLNRNDTDVKSIKINWDEIGIVGQRNVRDLWLHREIGKYTDSFSAEVKPHECVRGEAL